MKWKHYFCLLFVMFFCVGCMAKTTATLSYTPEGQPLITFYDTKTRQGVEVDITPTVNGLAKIHYAVKISDANAVALEALGLANTATQALSVIGAPIK